MLPPTSPAPACPNPIDQKTRLSYFPPAGQLAHEPPMHRGHRPRLQWNRTAPASARPTTTKPNSPDGSESRPYPSISKPSRFPSVLHAFGVASHAFGLASSVVKSFVLNPVHPVKPVQKAFGPAFAGRNLPWRAIHSRHANVPAARPSLSALPSAPPIRHPAPRQTNPPGNQPRTSFYRMDAWICRKPSWSCK